MVLAKQAGARQARAQTPDTQQLSNLKGRCSGGGDARHMIVDSLYPEWVRGQHEWHFMIRRLFALRSQPYLRAPVGQIRKGLILLGGGVNRR